MKWTYGSVTAAPSRRVTWASFRAASHGGPSQQLWSARPDSRRRRRPADGLSCDRVLLLRRRRRDQTEPYFGGWHEVQDASFGIDSYEFVWREGMGDSPMLGGGQEKHIAAGFTFSKGGHVLFGPPTSVLAIKTQR